MRKGIFTLGLIAAVSLPGCTGGNASSSAVTPTPAATPTPIATAASDRSFPGEAAQLVNEETNTPVEIRAEPSTQARSVATVPRDETLRAIDSTRDGEGRMWYRVRQASGVEGWVGGLFMRFVGDRDPQIRPHVVMPGGTWIVSEPRNGARRMGQVQGGEVLSVSPRVSNNVSDRESTWYYMGKGWVSGEFLFQPACIRFNGNRMMVVNISGAAVKSQPNSQAQEVKRLDGGQAVIPLRKQTNAEGEWLQTEQGWVNSKTLFTPACQQNVSASLRLLQ
jgi:hypothetical protein